MTIHELKPPSPFFSTQERIEVSKTTTCFSPKQRSGFNDIRIGINESGNADGFQWAILTTRLSLHLDLKARLEGNKAIYDILMLTTHLP
ncbi:hypothetical protein NPIL_277341 [Nephila pilipes]|uniref:Uncharacterized protein n=1 Tax=Nephila pilipes TaxID=299642 RepID=A0A8X6U1B1_NEPPI|nr:hypothetical protein NPIL_277341 [Nephila pilipes]